LILLQVTRLSSSPCQSKQPVDTLTAPIRRMFVYPRNRFPKTINEPKGRKMGFCRSGAITSLALLMSGTIQNGAPPGMQSIGNWWYKEPMLWIVVLIVIGIIVVKARQNK
jgi:hypothetical protein